MSKVRRLVTVTYQVFSTTRTLHHHPEMIVGPATWLELRPCSGMYMP
jgi:hypothetical protein